MHPLTDLAYLPLNEWQDHARDLIATALAERYQRVTKEALLDRGWQIGLLGSGGPSCW